MLWGVKPQHEGGAITSTPLGWELDDSPHPHVHPVIKGRVRLCLSSPWIAPSFERTGRSPLRTQHASFPCTALSIRLPEMPSLPRAFPDATKLPQGLLDNTCYPPWVRSGRVGLSPFPHFPRRSVHYWSPYTSGPDPIGYGLPRPLQSDLGYYGASDSIQVSVPSITSLGIPAFSVKQRRDTFRLLVRPLRHYSSMVC